MIVTLEDFYFEGCHHDRATVEIKVPEGEREEDLTDKEISDLVTQALHDTIY